MPQHWHDTTAFGRPMRKFILIALVLLCATIHAADPWSGECVGISDGDTISVMKDGKAVKIRLYGVDCPESGQDFGRRAKEFVADMTFHKTVTVTPTDTDRYGRTVAHIEVDGISVNRALAEAGLAWVYEQYCKTPECREWRMLQAEAKAEKRGLWSRADAVPPWDWRRNGNASPVTPARQPAAGTFSGNIKSAVFHRGGCPGYECKNCTASFASRDEAIAAGYRPCGNCKP